MCTDKSNPYFSSNYYSDIEKIYNSAKKKIEQQLKAHDSSNASPEIDSSPAMIKSQAERQAYFDLANQFLDKVQAKDLSEIAMVDDLECNLIKHLLVNGSHYQSAWAALNKRYNNKKALVTSNIKRLLSQKYVQAERADELRSLLDTTKEILYTLSNLGEPTEHWNSIAVFIVSHRMPAETMALWENQIAKNETIPPFSDLESQRNEYKVNVLEQGNTNKNCKICNGAHAIYTCAELKKLSVQERFEMIKKLNLCTVCSQSHATRECKSNWTCLHARKNILRWQIEKSDTF